MLAFVKKLLKRFSEDEVANRAAALSYFTIFSLGPLIFVILGVIGLILKHSTYKQHFLDQLQHLLGPQAGSLVNGLLNNQGLTHKSTLALVIGGVGLVLGAIGIFGQLQHSLNAILHIEIGPDAGFKATIKQKVVSLGLVGVICFLLIVSLIASAAISIITHHVQHGALGLLLSLADLAISIIVLSVLLAVLYRTLPVAKIPWKILFRTAFLVAIMFSLGKYLIGYIIGNNSSISAFGAAGSLIALLLWIFYSGQIIYLGAVGISLYVEQNKVPLTPRYPGRHGVLKVKETKKPLNPGLAGKTKDKFIKGFKRGWKK